jgi:hypothetical protein
MRETQENLGAAGGARRVEKSWNTWQQGIGQLTSNFRHFLPSFEQQVVNKVQENHNSTSQAIIVASALIYISDFLHLDF